MVDDIAPSATILSAAKAWALDMAAGRRPWLKSLYRTDKLETLGEARAILKFARSQTEQAAPNLTHPLRCLDAIEYGITHGGYAGSVKVRNITKCQAIQFYRNFILT